MIKYIIILSVLFSGCINEIGDDNTTIVQPADESDDNDRIPVPSGPNPGQPIVGNGQTVSGCTLEDASNYKPSATIACTTGCVDGKTGANCCCED